jgi:hypothetical protein
MAGNIDYRRILLLKKMFPEFENKLDYIYRQDPLFREIAKEIYVCISKQEMICKRTGKKSNLFTDTITELKNELLDYMNNLKSDDRFPGGK